MATAQTIKKDGRTLYRVQIRRPTKGLNIDKYFGGKREANAYIRDVEHAIKNNKPISDNVQIRKLFMDAVETYLSDPEAFKTPKGRELKDSAKKDRQNRLRFLSRSPNSKSKKQKEQIGGDLGGIHLKNLTWETIDSRLKKLSRDYDWSPASRYRYETTLSRFLDYCRKQGWVSHNVMTDQARLNDSGSRARIYTEKEWQALLDAADKQDGMLAMFLRLAWETGARKGELINLRWVDIERVEQNGLGAKLHLIDTKNREPRTVFISDDTYRLLRTHEHQFRLPSSLLVFPSRTRDGRYSVDQQFRSARQAANLDKPDSRHGEVLNIHHLRHTWATRLGDSGASLAQLMAAAGWKTPGMAERYMKRKESQAAEAALLLMGK